LPAPAAPIVTARLRPDLFEQPGKFPISPRALIALLAIIILAGFGFRAYGLGAEALSEDELNKYNAVEEYRAHGVTSANGEHPMLMKALITASLVSADAWNDIGFVKAHPALAVSAESAVRLPSSVFGALTPLLIYLVLVELFGVDVALIAAALWAFDPNAIGFNRIAKEDTFLLFFFLLANVFWLRGQRVAEGEPDRSPQPYYWATAVAFGAMIASKYLPHLLAVSISYNYIFQGLPATRWQIGKRRFLIFFAIMGATFLLCNPAVLLAETRRQMFNFAGYKLVAHDSYEFMGKLYSHKVLVWLSGTPWYFYFTFMAVKMPLATLAAFIVGLPLLFRRRVGDGRFFILFWAFYWFLPFTLIGGKFTRYFTVGYAVVIITAAIGLHYIAWWLARQLTAVFGDERLRGYFKTAVATLVVLASGWAAAAAAPHYRLYMNAIGGPDRAGYYFPHDEFYDASIRDTMNAIAKQAQPGARVASETPGLAEFYAKRAGRHDLVCVSLSDLDDIKTLSTGDYIVYARGRLYFSNMPIVNALKRVSNPVIQVYLGRVPSVDVYLLDQNSLTEAHIGEAAVPDEQ
jgi:hypothetical protein